MFKAITLVLFTTCAAFLTGCSDPNRDAVKIGMNIELTGEIPAVGASSKNAAELFFNALNEQGGVTLAEGPKKKVALVIRDNGGKADQAASVAQQLISSQEVIAMVGPNSSACAIPAGEIAESLKCVMISPWSTNPKTTLDQASGQPKRYVFRGCFTDPFQAIVLAKFALNDLGAKKAAVLYDVSSEAPLGQATLFKDTFTAQGGEIVAFETFTTGDKDFSAQLTNIRRPTRISSSSRPTTTTFRSSLSRRAASESPHNSSAAMPGVRPKSSNSAGPTSTARISATTSRPRSRPTRRKSSLPTTPRNTVRPPTTWLHSPSTRAG